MVKIGLQLKANLENIESFATSGEDFRWYLKLKCMNCGEEPDKWQYVALTENFPLKGGRGNANFVSKCKLCSRENSVAIVTESLAEYKAEDNEKFKTVVAFDCRGVEPFDFSPRVGFTAKVAESGKVFTDINLQEKEWVDYDEKSQNCVGIYELQHKFQNI